MPVQPVCLGLILCEAVVHHPETGRMDILGSFWEVDVPTFPANTGPITAWVAVVNGAGRVRMRLKFELLPPDRPEEEPIVDIPFTMDFTDPRQIQMYVNEIQGIDLVGPGQYRVTLTAYDATLVEGYFIARTRSAN